MWVPETEHSILPGHLSSPYFWGFAFVLGHCEWDGIPWSFSSSTEKLGPSVHGGTYLNPNPSSVANSVRPCRGRGGNHPKNKIFVVCPRSVSGGGNTVLYLLKDVLASPSVLLCYIVSAGLVTMKGGHTLSKAFSALLRLLDLNLKCL